MRESVMAAAPRMSMSALNGTDDPDRQVRIWLLSAVNVKGATYYRVAGRFVSSGQTWQVNRRYSEFLMLRDTLVKYFSRAMDTCPGCLNYLHAIRSFDFPKKHVFVSKSQIVVNYRVKALRSFMNLLASWAFSNSPKCPTCGGFAFDIVRNFVLEGADAVGEISDMNYIRESFVVSTFTDAGRRSSLTRRNSFVPPSSQPANPQSQRRSMQVQQYQQSQRQSQLQRRNTSDSLPGSNQAQMDSDAYDAFNDYLVRHPTKSAHARSSINIPANLLKEQQQAAAAASRSSSSRQVSSSSSASQDPRDGTRPSTSSRQQPQRADQNGSTSTSGAHNGSFLFYQDGANHTSSSSRASSRQAPPSSTGSKHGILKNWNDVRQDRSQNGSYMSLGASSTDDDAKTPRGSRQRPPSRNRNDNRSQNNSYFSLGASSADSREANENVAPRSSNKHAGQDYTAPQVRYDRSQNESYLSIGGSDNGDLEEEYHSHHPSVLASPTNARFVQPPPTQKYVGPSSSANDAPRSSQRQQQPKPSKSKSQRVMDEQSFTSDASLRFDGMVGVATDGSDSDDIDIAGVMIDDHHHPQLRKSKSGQGLWATWELAKAS